MKTVEIHAAAYARYSTALQTETSIAAQLKGILDYCDKHDLTIVATYVDEARSGTNTDREGFQRLLIDAANHKFDAVVVYDVSRGSRDVGDWFNFRRLMQEYGIAVHSVTNTLGNPDDPDSYLMELLTVGIGQHQVLQSRQKSIAGKRISAERGLFCGGIAPFGYSIDNQHYIINRMEAPYVQRIFEMYAAGASYGDIISMLNAANMRGRRGQTFSATTLHDILKNERYKGTFLWFETEERHMKKHVGRKNDNPVRIDSVIPRIISDELFDEVQARMKENTHNRTNHAVKRTYYLSGLVYCGKCGSALTGYTTTSKGYEYKRYMCIKKRKYKTCDLKNVNGVQLENAAIKIIREKILNDSTIEQLADYVLNEMQHDDGARAQLEGELKEVTKRYNNLYDACEQGLPYADVAPRLTTLKNRRDELTRQLDSMTTRDIPTRESVIAVLRADTQKLLKNHDSIYALLHKYVYKVIVNDDTIEFQLKPLANLYKINKNRVDVHQHGELLRYVIPRVDLQAA